MLAHWMPWALRGELCSERVAANVLRMSARTIDRVLHAKRGEIRRRLYGTTKPGTLLKHQIPIRSERWDVGEPGWMEIDTVSHCGDAAYGEFIYSLNCTDIATTWTETRAVLGKGQIGITDAIEDIRRHLPFTLKGLDSDSGSEFINANCVQYCARHNITFTRSRPYRKNDNAHVEQKNWTHVRKIFGWQRLAQRSIVEAMNELYGNDLRLWMNYYQANVKLVEKARVGSRVRRRYDCALTPLDRLIATNVLTADSCEQLEAERASVNPFALSDRIDRKIGALLSLAAEQPAPPPTRRPGPRPSAPSSAARKKHVDQIKVRSHVAR